MNSIDGGSYPEILALIHQLDYMDDWEYDFMLSILERDWLSDKQYDIVKRLYKIYILDYL